MKKNYSPLNRLWICVVLMLAAAFSASAQERVTFKHSKATEVIPSVNLVVVSANKKSLALGGLANIVREKAYGLQIGGLYNHFGMGGGLAVGGLLNTTSNSYYGMQIGGLANMSKDAAGLQIGGLSNVTRDFYGVQVAGVMNAARDTYGLQLAGVANLARGNVYGLQFAGVTNVAKDVCGLQFAGVANIAKKVRGVQFAAILNVAEESDLPIGLINIIGNGDMGVALTCDILGNSMVTFRSGGRYTYGILGAGYNQYLAEKVVAEAGYGIHLPLCRGLQINNELKATAPINTSSVNFSYLLAPSVTLCKHLNLFGGPSFNFLMFDTAEAANLLPRHTLWRKESGEGIRSLYIGYQAGVQYVF